MMKVYPLRNESLNEMKTGIYWQGLKRFFFSGVLNVLLIHSYYRSLTTRSGCAQ